MTEEEGEDGKPRFDRRSLLLSVGTGFSAAVAGCNMLGDASQSTPTGTEPAGTAPESTPTAGETATETAPESTPTDEETETETPQVSTPSASVAESNYMWHVPHPLSATKMDVDDPVAFEDLSDDYQVVVANGIIRSGYPLDHNYSLDAEAVRYEGSTFSIGVASVWPSPPEKTPGGAGWQEPLSLSASVEDESFVVSVTNEMDEPIPVHHYERPSPYFSILVAVSDDPKLLSHDGYEHMKALRTEDVVRIPSVQFWMRKLRDAEQSTATQPPATDSESPSTDTEDLPSSETLLERRRKSQITHLEPGESLRESYGLPSELPPESTVWFSLPIGDESTDVTGGREWTFTATITLRT